MQVHRQHAVGAGAGDEVGDELGGDGIAALGLAVLPGIAEIRNDGGDAACGGAAESVDHDEQLHQVVVDGLAGGLDNENVAAAHRFVDGYGDLAVGEGGDIAVAQSQAQLAADAFRKGLVCVGGEYLDLFSVCNHFMYLYISEPR